VQTVDEADAAKQNATVKAVIGDVENAPNES